MAGTIKTKEEIAILREGGQKLAAIRDALASRIAARVSAREIEDYASELFAQAGGVSSFLNYRPKRSKEAYPARTYISVNEVIVHGLPSAERIFQEGDIVGIDVGMKYQGLFTDTAVTMPVGRVSKEAEKLLEVTKSALAVGIGAVRAGVTTGDIGSAIESFVQSVSQFGIVKTLGGHGVGYAVHEEPHLPNFGRRGEGETLRAGMVVAIEPMLTLGSPDLVLAADGHSFRTKDGSLGAHFEHTLVITEKGCEILTRR